VDIRGVYRFSSLMKQKLKAKICFVIHIAGFFFKKKSVMKCLQSKKRRNAPPITTLLTKRGHPKNSHPNVGYQVPSTNPALPAKSKWGVPRGPRGVEPIGSGPGPDVWGSGPRGAAQLGWYHNQVTLYNICSLAHAGDSTRSRPRARGGATSGCPVVCVAHAGAGMAHLKISENLGGVALPLIRWRLPPAA
jgi:hypothetical protein